MVKLTTKRLLVGVLSLLFFTSPAGAMEDDTDQETAGDNHSYPAGLDDSEQYVDSNDDDNRSDEEMRTFSDNPDDEEENPEEDGSADVGCSFRVSGPNEKSTFVSLMRILF